MVMPRYLLLFLLDLRILKLGDPLAPQTQEVVVVMSPQPTCVETVAPIEIMHFQEVTLCQKPKRAVNRCPGDSRPAFAKLFIQLLCTEVPVSGEGLGDGLPALSCEFKTLFL